MAKWKEDPQGRDFIEEVTEILELPIYTAQTKGRFRPWLKESWGKVEDKIVKTVNDKQDKNDKGLETTSKEVVGAINELNKLKQNKQDFNLLTDAKTVVGAINEVNDKVVNIDFSKLEEEIALNKDLSESIAGAKINVEFIQDAGQKLEGEYYIDKPTKRIFKCLKTTSITSNTPEFFRDESNSKLAMREVKKPLRNIVNDDISSNITKVYPLDSSLKFLIIYGSIGKRAIEFAQSMFFPAIPNQTYLCAESTSGSSAESFKVTYNSDCSSVSVTSNLSNGCTVYEVIQYFY